MPRFKPSSYPLQEERFTPYGDGNEKLMPDDWEDTGYEPPIGAIENANLGVRTGYEDQSQHIGWGLAEGARDAGTPGKPPEKRSRET